MSTNGYFEVSSRCPDVPSVQTSTDTLVPNRIFVGGISAHTTEAELHTLFSKYGSVKAAKIITDKTGLSKGYGFVTFDTEEEAKKLQKEGSVILSGKRLNIAPAIIKRRSQHTETSQDSQTCNIPYHGNVSSTYGVLYAPSYGLYFQPQPAYSMLIPHPQYVYQPQNVSSYIYGPTSAPTDPYIHGATFRQGQQEQPLDISSDIQDDISKCLSNRCSPLHRPSSAAPYIYCDHPIKATQVAKFAMAAYPPYTLQMTQDRLHQECDIPETMLQSCPLTPPSTPVASMGKHYKTNS
ncbi:protein boule-like [Centruroides sculpturatus]|uniref:protein boule-like n=1 Tax=Centruroides sculpturatus TaxID=218467 RepID=UPI000C6DA85F|nr:protein boule-like [Centruroides sculpturatus]